MQRSFGMQFCFLFTFIPSSRVRVCFVNLANICEFTRWRSCFKFFFPVASCCQCLTCPISCVGCLPLTYLIAFMPCCCVGGVSQYGYTVLILAADHGHADCVRLLLDAGADKNAKGNVRRRRSLLCRAPSCFVSSCPIALLVVIGFELCLRLTVSSYF